MLEIVDPPRFAEMHSYTCMSCEREDLQRPVFLSDGRVVGTGCAARLLGINERAVVVDRDRRDATARQRISVDEDRRQRYVVALADFRAKGSCIVREDPVNCVFNALRLEHGRRDSSLLAPVVFAAWLESRITELAR